MKNGIFYDVRKSPLQHLTSVTLIEATCKHPSNRMAEISAGRIPVVYRRL